MVAQRCRGVVASVYAGRPAGTTTIEGRTVNTRADWILSVPPKNLSGMMDEDGGWKKVRHVQQAGEAEVWDIQVDDESFTVEGCIVHNCPLQLGIVRRCVELWSNRGDVVFSPFAGIGTECVVAVEEHRKAIGCELKESYWKVAKRNLEVAEDKASQVGLFDHEEAFSREHPCQITL